MVQAGHPHPAIQRADGRIEYLGQGGLPIGLFDDAAYQSFETRLQSGDRLFLMSDGVTELETRGVSSLARKVWRRFWKACTRSRVRTSSTHFWIVLMRWATWNSPTMSPAR